MSEEKAFRGDVWVGGGPQSRQHVHALRTLLEVWWRHVLADSRMTPQYHEWGRRSSVTRTYR